MDDDTVDRMIERLDLDQEGVPRRPRFKRTEYLDAMHRRDTEELIPGPITLGEIE